MKKILRVGSLILFFALIFGLYFYYKMEDSKASKYDSREIEKAIVEGESTKEEVLESRLTFDKNISFVYIGELNSLAVAGLPFGEITTLEVSFNEDTKAVYFYKENLIPSPNDNLLIVRESNSMDILMEQEVIKGQNQARTYIREIYQDDTDNDYYRIINEGRLFLDSNIDIKLLNEQGDIEVSIDGQKKILKSGEAMPLMRAENKEGIDFKSKLVITNFGLWWSKNMKYVVDIP